MNSFVSLHPRLILGSTSVYRKELLNRLRLPFTVQHPAVDETPLIDEVPAILAQRLSCSKARSVAAMNTQHDVVVIGSDQVADLEGMPLGKPHTHERAVQQLQAMSGKTVVFQTAVTVVRKGRGFEETRIVPTAVRFRTLRPEEIENYLRTEQPYDCAGSAKSEGLGIALLASLASEDPTALIGLPLIATCELLRMAGLDPLPNNIQ
jgi:septum formation protein